MQARTPRTSLWGMVAATAGFIVWSLLALRTPALAWLDAVRAPSPPRDGAVAEVLRAIAVLTLPLVVWAGLCAMAWWAWNRRLRRLSWALLLSGLITWTITSLLRHLIHRARPEGPFGGLFSARGWSYPSGHMAMITTAAIMVAVAASTTRRRRATQFRRRTLAVLAMAVVALDRWALGVHWVTDLVGGALLGAATTSATLLLCGVRTLPPWDLMVRRARTGHGGRVCAVVFNPAKVLDAAVFTRIIEDELCERGWQAPIWLPTTPDDPGHAMTREAIDREVDLVLVAGGDGTVRVVSSGLVDSGIPLGLIPAGTANLLARNLGIPHDDEAALTIAFTGRPVPIDVVRIEVDPPADAAPDAEPVVEHFAVMGGMGIDAKVMSDTSVQLKRAVKSVAYGVAVAQNLRTDPVPVSVWVDDELVSDDPASLVLLGNVGEIQAGLQFFPDASATDGSVDVLITGPRGVAGWLRWIIGVATRQTWRSVETSGQRVVVRATEPMPYQLDGDTLGVTERFEARVLPGAIRVMLPRV